jgi:formylglycine-generating enzyme required for sulfatase activity
MGSPDDEDKRAGAEGPVHEVRISYALAVSRYPITRGQWRQYLSDSGRLGSRNCYGFNYAQGKWAKTEGYGWDDPGYRQEDSHPVVCVSWDEAQNYAAWLSMKTGHHYRLLSEAELEYVERARSRTAYPWGASSDGQCARVNAADVTAAARFAGWADAASCSDGFLFTSPVDHFPPSALGLHDTDGNARSWTLDCYHDSYRGAPADGSAWDSGGDCSFRMIRGASWSTRPEGLRSAARRWELAVANADDTGLRVARTDLTPVTASPER